LHAGEIGGYAGPTAHGVAQTRETSRR